MRFDPCGLRSRSDSFSTFSLSPAPPEQHQLRSVPISIEGRQDGVGIIYHCYGHMTIGDFFQAGNGFLAYPEEIKKWRYAIVDLTSAGNMQISSDEIRSVVEQNKRIASIAHAGVILAVAAPRDLGFGLSRMWEILMEQIGWETMTFRSLEEADDWVRHRVKQKFDLEIPLASSAD